MTSSPTGTDDTRALRKLAVVSVEHGKSRVPRLNGASVPLDAAVRIAVGAGCYSPAGARDEVMQWHAARLVW